MLDYNTQYPTKTAAPSANYPYGGPQNITVPGDGLGTPWEAAIIGDLIGFPQAIVTEAGIVPSGNPETAVASDQLDALFAILKSVRNPYMNSMHFQHTELSGVTGGDMAGNVYVVRPINNVSTNGCYNNIVGASLAANQITLPEGTYRISANACAYNVGGHRLKLIMDGTTDLVIGTMSGNADTASLIQPNSLLSDQQFAIPSGVHYVEIEMWSTDSNAASTSYGVAAAIAGEIENYLSGTITQVI